MEVVFSVSLTPQFVRIGMSPSWKTIDFGALGGAFEIVWHGAQFHAPAPIPPLRNQVAAMGAAGLRRIRAQFGAGQSGEARIFLTQDNNLTAKVPLRRSILQCNLQQKYRLMGKHNPQRDDGPEKGLYRLPPIALRENRYARQTFKFRRPISCIAP